MQPVLTMEVRWFYKEGLLKPTFDLHKFRKGDPSLDQRKGKIRTDFYLSLPSVESLGTKLRGEEDQSERGTSKKEINLEVKSRQREYGIITFPNGQTGRLEYWSKSAFSTESTNPQIFDLLQAENNAWIVVTKERYLRLYEVVAGKEVHSFPLEKRCTGGCRVELTKLTVHQQNWWTLGFEAFGETEEAMTNNLKLSAHAFFTQTAWEGLEEKDSSVYPQWLNSVTASSSAGHNPRWP
jgi:hypothetical protein